MLARADGKGWSETYVGLLMDSLGGRFQDLEPTLWRKVLALVSSGADAHDAVLAALADVLRPAWACAACTLENAGAADFCVVCATPRGAVESAPPPARDRLPNGRAPCARCGTAPSTSRATFVGRSGMLPALFCLL